MAEIASSPTDLVPVSRSLPAPKGGMGALAGLAGQPAVAKSLPMLGLLALLAIGALLWMNLSTGPQKPLFAGLADSDKQAVAEALGSAGIPYEVDSGTGAITVADDQFHQAKMLLAGQGLPKSAPNGDSMISSLPLGASRAVEGERLRGARELDLARTIEAIDAVEAAKIHIAVEQPSVFLRDQSKPAASVMLRLRSGRQLTEQQVQAIVHLVASSVSGMSPDGVSVVDQSGRLLSRVGNDAAAAQIDAQSRVEERYRQALATLLVPIVGAGNYTAEVNADMDFSEVQATRETYPANTQVVRSEQGSWTNQTAGAGGEAIGVPGTLANQAPVAAQVTDANGPVTPATAAGQAGAQAPGKINESYNRTFDVGREVSVTKNQAGTLRRLSVAVAIKNPAKGIRSAAEMAQIDALVKGAVGFNQARGDVVAITARAFAPVEAAGEAASGEAFYEAGWFQMLLRNLTALAVAAIVVFGLARPLLKRRAAAAAATQAKQVEQRQEIGTQLASAIADHNAANPGKPVTLDMIQSAPGYAQRAALIRSFVQQDPDRAALVVRDLIRSDMPEAA